jgi:hypothetical protein
MTAVTTSRHSVGERASWTQFIPSWRSSADKALEDRLATASVGLVGAVVGTAVALLARGTTVAVWVGLVTLCVTPGCALVCWLPTRERLARVVAVVAASLTWTVLFTSMLAWLQVTMLGVLLMATAGLGGIGSAVFLIAQLARYLKRLPVVVPVDEGENFSGWPSGWTVEDNPRPRSSAASRRSATPAVASRRSARPQSLLMSSLVGAAVLLAIAVIQARGHAVGNFGLLPLLGVPFLAASVLTIGALVLALRLVRNAWPAAIAALGLLLFEINGTQMMLAATPLGNVSTYEHFGVVDYLVHGGALNDPLDVYQQWPGFFAAAAGLVRLSGRSPLVYSNWAQLFFEALNAVVLFAIARRFSQGHRVIPYVTVLLFETANWEGQFYYAPQASAFLLALLFLFFLIPLLEPARLRRPFLRLRWLSASSLEIQGKESLDTFGMAVRVVGLVAVFGAITVTHQLSPYFVFVGVAGLWVLGILRHSLLVLILTVALVGYPLLHTASLDHNQWLNGFSFSNATSAYPMTNGGPVEIASHLSKAIGLGFWTATAVCGLSYRRRLGILAIPIVLAITPVSLILLDSYGGEAINRVFLSSSPWCALIIAMRLGDLARVPMLRWTAVGFWALLAALGSAQAQDFGVFQTEQITPGEIHASAYFLDHAPPKAMLVLAVPDFPARVNGRYVLHDATQTVNDPVASDIANCSAPLSQAISSITPASCRRSTDSGALARSVATAAKGSGYLVIGPSMDRYASYSGDLAPGTLSALVSRLKASRYWRVWYDSNGVVIFQALPEGRTEGGTR